MSGEGGPAVRLTPQLHRGDGLRCIAPAWTAEDDQDLLVRAQEDLLTPLRVIKNLPDWIRDDFADARVDIPDAAEANLNSVISQAQRLERMVDDYLRYERMRYYKPLAEELCAHTRLTELAEIILPEGPWTLEFIGDLPTLTVDLALFDEIFSALIDNAVKHHPTPHGAIRAELRCDAQGPSIAICDDGAGIRAEDQDRVFLPFETLRPRDELEGTGLGLSRVLRAAGLIGGTVSVGAGVGGQGTCVRIDLPPGTVATG